MADQREIEPSAWEWNKAVSRIRDGWNNLEWIK